MNTTLIVPPGASPHTFELSPSGAQAIEQAEVIFAVGELDEWITKTGSNTPVVIVDSNIRYIDTDEDEEEAEEEHDEDPHYWLSAANAMIIADNITASLVEIDPANADYYQTNNQQYQLELSELHEEIIEALIPLNNPKIGTFHGAWDYFARDYGIEIAATFEEFPGKVPGPKYLSEFADTLATGEVRAVYSEPQLPTDKLQLIADQYNVAIGILDPLGGVEGRSTYIELMRYNTVQLISTLTTN